MNHKCPGCAQYIESGQNVLIVYPPGFDIPESIYHERCRGAAERFCDESNRRLDEEGRARPYACCGG